MLRSAAVWREDLVSATPRSRPGSRTEGSTRTLESKETTSTIVIYITSEPQPEPNGSARLLLVLRCWSRQDLCHRRHHRSSILRYSQSALRPLDQQLAHTQAALELYYRTQLRHLPLLGLAAQGLASSGQGVQHQPHHHQYSTYLAQLAARAAAASASQPSPPPSPPLNTELKEEKEEFP